VAGWQDPLLYVAQLRLGGVISEDEIDLVYHDCEMGGVSLDILRWALE